MWQPKNFSLNISLFKVNNIQKTKLEIDEFMYVHDMWTSRCITNYMSYCILGQTVAGGFSTERARSINSYKNNWYCNNCNLLPKYLWEMAMLTCFLCIMYEYTTMVLYINYWHSLLLRKIIALTKLFFFSQLCICQTSTTKVLTFIILLLRFEQKTSEQP